MLGTGGRLGRYEVLELIGRGGMAAVYRGHHTALDRPVAIKVLPEFFAEDEVARERFRQEARAIARLRHPNILSVFDYGEEDGQTYIVSEFVEGGTLATRISGGMAPEEAARMLSPVSNALDYAHSQGILHRDVKPANILIGSDGQPVVGDFGLARMMDSAGQRLTVAGSALGTPEYMAPEQSMGLEVTGAADIYSLAAVAYEMVTGSPPFSGPTPMAVMLAHMQQAVPPAVERNPQVSAAADLALARGLAKAPGERYPSSAQFVQALYEAGTPSGQTAVAAVVVVSLSPGPELQQAADWRAEIARLRELRARYLLVYGGKDYQAFGDGMAACFEGVLPAVRCVSDVRALGERMGLVFSAGVAFGEVTRTDGSASGPAVQQAASLCRQAPGGEILVTPEVRELVDGFGPRLVAVEGLPQAAYRISATG